MTNKLYGKITASVGGLYTVYLDAPVPADIAASLPDGRRVDCRARGAFRHNNEKPLVGDRCAVSFGEAANGTVIDSIEERKNSLIRPPVANLDYIFVTAASASPEPDPEMLDKLIAIAEFNGITPVVVIGKSDLNPARAEELAGIYRLAGYDVFVVSCKENEGILTDGGLRDFIKEIIPHNTVAFAGASGVGKSSLINILFPDLDLEVSDISRKTERGRHTTRRVTLYPTDSTDDPGFIVDTPGFSFLDFEHFDFFSKEDLPETFREFREHLGTCKYTKCTHTKEDGCSILAAMREGRISPSRHQSYLNLYAILKEKHKWDKK